MTDTTSTLAPALEPRSARAASARALLALFQRDAWVMVSHELAAFLAQSLLQPIFFLLVFGRILPEIGAAQGSYGAQLLPGVVALTLFLTSLQNVALPLVIEFAFTKEIEDRLLAPLPAWLVAVQKIGFGAFRGVIAAVLVIPLAAIILPGGVELGSANWAAVIAIVLAGSIAGAATGLVMGTTVPVQKINVVFAVVLTPLIFTGATFYPWQALDKLRWFQVLTLVNPLTYVSEGMRGSLAGLPHLGSGWITLGLGVALVVFIAVGITGFVRRAID